MCTSHVYDSLFGPLSKFKHNQVDSKSKEQARLWELFFPVLFFKTKAKTHWVFLGFIFKKYFLALYGGNNGRCSRRLLYWGFAGRLYHVSKHVCTLNSLNNFISQPIEYESFLGGSLKLAGGKLPKRLVFFVCFRYNAGGFVKSVVVLCKRCGIKYGCCTSSLK